MAVIKDLNRLLKPEEIAKILGTKLSTIQRWVFEKKIPYVKFGPGRKSKVMFDPERINKWIKEQSHEPLSDFEKFGPFLQNL